MLRLALLGTLAYQAITGNTDSPTTFSNDVISAMDSSQTVISDKDSIKLAGFLRLTI